MAYCKKKDHLIPVPRKYTKKNIDSKFRSYKVSRKHHILYNNNNQK